MRVVVVRPAPGDARTLAALAAAGVDGEAIALFEVVPVAWSPPAPAGYDAVLLTSANAVRHGGAGLAALAGLPVVAVGEATARIARAAGMTVALTGTGDAAAVVAAAATAGMPRLLHLAGRDRMAAGSATVTVYASEPRRLPPGTAARFAGATVLLHSARGAARVALLVDAERIDRGDIGIAAFSPAVAAAAGGGWRRVAIAATPDDRALIAAAIDRGAAPEDKSDDE